MSPASPQPSRRRVYTTLFIGVLAVSTAALFIRLAQGTGASSLAIAAGRLTIASLLIVPLAIYTYGATLRGLDRATHIKFSFIGLLLALHFWLWISSLAFVSVALSTALAATVPIWTALIAWVVRGERLTTSQTLGLVLAVVGGGALALTSGGVTQGNSLMVGCLLAVSSALAIAINMLIGQRLRQNLPVKAYVSLTYGWAAVWLLIALVVTGTPILGLDRGAYLAMLALALVPQLIGHTAFNWALPYLGATTVAVSVLGEPIGAAVLATLLLNEPITLTMLVCFAVTLAGIVLVAVRRG